MEREGVEKLGVEGLISGVQGVGIGAGKRKTVRNEDAKKDGRKVKTRTLCQKRKGMRHPRLAQ